MNSGQVGKAARSACWDGADARVRNSVGHEQFASLVGKGTHPSIWAFQPVGAAQWHRIDSDTWKSRRPWMWDQVSLSAGPHTQDQGLEARTLSPREVRMV